MAAFLLPLETIDPLSFSEFSNFEEFTAYEVADMIKLYCRELPEPLLTNKLSEILVLIQESEENVTIQ